MFETIKNKLAIRRSEAVIKENSKTFYRAFKAISNPQQRNGVFAVYAFCRYADDLIDEAHDEKALNQLERDIVAFFDHPSKSAKSHWRMRALTLPYDHFYKNMDVKIARQPYLDMIRGQRMDLTKNRYQTYEELLDYCYCVASSVGLMLLPILAPETHLQLKDCAIHLGYAMQLTNILRDIGEDYRRGRVYLPLDWMQQANYTMADLEGGIINDSFKALFEKIAAQATHYYQLAHQDMHLFPEETRHPLAIAALLYEQILNACRKEDYDVFSKKNFVNHEEKAKMISEYRKGLKV